MAYVYPTDFSLTLLPENRVRVNVQFSVSLTATEARLEIPSRVYVKLMERDNTRDETHLYAEWWGEWVRERGDEDDPATGWMYAGTFASSTTGSFSRVLNRNNLPGESGNEEWYCVLRSRPDIVSDIRYSVEISANLN
jgi:hypothetical protein